MGIMVLLLAIVYPIGTNSHIQGFSEIKQAEEEMIGLSIEIHMNMQQIAVSMIIMGLIGAILDVSIAVSSSLYEIYQHRPDSTEKELFYAGIHIGGDIIGTTANTLLFAYLSEFLMLFIRFQVGNTTLIQILHSKAFCQEFIRILLSGIGCILSIPVTSAVLVFFLKKAKKEVA